MFPVFPLFLALRYHLSQEARKRHPPKSKGKGKKGHPPPPPKGAHKKPKHGKGKSGGKGGKHSSSASSSASGSGLSGSAKPKPPKKKDVHGKEDGELMWNEDETDSTATRQGTTCHTGSYGCCPDGKHGKENLLGTNCEGYVQPSPQRSPVLEDTPSPPKAAVGRVTTAGDACAKSFAYKGKTYADACTSVDVKKGEWCYLPKGAKGKDGKNWGMCAAPVSTVAPKAAVDATRPASAPPQSVDRKTTAGDACAKSFAYKGKTYTGACTSVDIKRGEWCYLPKGAKGKDGKNWGMCAEASFPMPFWEASTAAGVARFKEAPATRKLRGARRGRARDASSVLLEAEAGTTKKNKGKKGDSDSVRATDVEALKWTTGEKTLLIVFADHASLPGAPITADQAVDLTGKISDFLSSNNNGQISITATVGTTIYRPQMELGLAANKADKPSADVFLEEVKSLARGDTSGDYDADQVQFQCEVKLSSP